MGELVKLYVYDLSKSSHASSHTSSSSSGITGIPLIYHTSIVVFDTEYSFNSSVGITIKRLPVDKPDEIHKLGNTKKTKFQLERFVETLADDFRKTCYELLQRNCQEFCIQLCEFLEVDGLPPHIRTLPQVARDVFGSETGLIGAAVALAGIFAFSLYKALPRNNTRNNN